VFWSKNPAPLIKHLPELKAKGINCYIQFTLNDYVTEGLEAAVPSVDSRIETFKSLVKELGVGRVIWRFDPLILTEQVGVNELIHKIEYIGDRLKGYTEKLVFSFVDISLYKKVESNLKKAGIAYKEWTADLMNEFASKLSELNKKWGYTLATCGEKIDIEQYGITHNKCIDDELIIRLAHDDDKLMQHLGVSIEEAWLLGDIPEGSFEIKPGVYAVKKKNAKDRGQRAFCGCISSKDIGEYNTCIHQCEYCYANASKEVAKVNYQRHKSLPTSETIIGL
jgi:DNA repair photolyase